MNRFTKNITLAFCVVALIAIGCARDSNRNNAIKTGQHTSIDSGENTKGPTSEISAPGADLQRIKTVYFDYDSYGLRSDALVSLKNNAAVFTKDNQRAPIQIEGHCDERGTQEYNLALGEQRALAVRHHLINLGVSETRISTISYGEERPADPAQTEASFALNRRCEFNGDFQR